MHAFPRITAGLSAARAAMQRAVKERAATGSAADSLHRPEIFSVSVSPGVTAGFRQQPEMERGRLSRGKLARADRKRASRNGGRAFHESFSLPVRATGLGNAEFTKKMHQSRIRVLVLPSHRATSVIASLRFVDARCASLNPIIFRYCAMAGRISRNIEE
jgi:hypothetical protein